MGSEASSLDVATIVIGLAGGLALFLFGMEQMTDALKVVAGDRMRTILGKLTTNRISAALTGAFVTAVIQSSSVTTVLVVGFISAGLMSLAQSVGVIMGANIGTTITAQIIAFKVTKYALILIAIGFGMLFAGKKENIRQIGAMVMGLGLIFFGMDLMSDATRPLRSYEPFIQAMQSMDRPMLAILVSAAFTALVQSSSATTGIVIVLASQGFITLEAGIALALGANIGTCVTALLASLGKPREALQAATVHVVFNVVGVLFWVGLVGVLADLVRSVSPVYVDLEGQARLAAETPRQIANAHTIFNIVNTLVFLPFTVQLGRLIERLVPIKPTKIPERAKPRFLEEVYLDTPALAIDRVRLEIGHLGELVLGVLGTVQPAPGSRDRSRVAEGVEDVELLHAELLRYARRISQAELGERDSRKLEDLLRSANHMQNIADTVAVNIRSMLREWDERGLQASDETRERIGTLFENVVEAVSLSVDAVRDDDMAKAGEVVGFKKVIVGDADRLASHLAMRLAAADQKDVAVYRFESEALELLKRIYYFAKRIAKTAARMTEEPEV
jgi:phosphate:Na+ symporter